MIAIVTDRVQTLTCVESGVLLIPPYENLAGEGEMGRRFVAITVIVGSLEWHNTRFQAWLREHVVPHAVEGTPIYPTMTPVPAPDRPDLDASMALFRHVPDGALFRHEGVTYAKIRPGAYRDANAVVIENDETQVVIDPGDCAVFELDVVVTFDHNDPTIEGLEAVDAA